MADQVLNGKIQTVLGRIAAADLGVVDAHTHVIRTGGPLVDSSKDFLLASVDKAVDELNDFKSFGGCAVVDMTPSAPGRNAEMMAEVSKQTGVHVIASTGFIDWALYPGQRAWMEQESVESLASLIAAEVEEGIDAYNYCGPIVKRGAPCAGVIKLVTGYQYITAFQQRMIEASALAHKQTGAPISVHTEQGTMVLELVAELSKQGVDPEAVIIGHTFLNPDPGYQRAMAETGVYLIQDGPGRVKYYPESNTVEQIERFLSDGFGGQLLFASDSSKASYWKACGGGPGHSYILDKFIPRLHKAGIPESATNAMLLDNAAKAFRMRKVD